MTFVGIHTDTFFNALTNMNIRRLANTCDLLVIQRQRGPLVLELVSLVEGGQGVGLNRDVAIFVFFTHFFCLVFVFLFIFFPFGLFPFIPSADPFQHREIFAITYF